MLLVAMLLTVVLHSQPLTGAGQSTSADCVQALAGGANSGAAQICLGEQQIRIAEAAAKDTDQRRRSLKAAEEHYRRAVNLTPDMNVKTAALDALIHLYEAPLLNLPSSLELVLRESIGTFPHELKYVYRLARLQEDEDEIDLAETTLLRARQLRPNDLEPHKMLAQFYARRVAVLSEAKMKEVPLESPLDPGQPDKNGAYWVGGNLRPPRRLDNPEYPTAARDAGIQGVVTAEVTINENGVVSDARVVRSIPLLDESALATVRNWRFTPTMVNGRAVPVKMTVSVHFTLADR
jgi:TonB family protein